MKNTIKLAAKLEGKKSQVAIGNLRESYKVLACIVVSQYFEKYPNNVYQDEPYSEWNAYTIKIYNKLRKKFPNGTDFDTALNYLMGNKK